MTRWMFGIFLLVLAWSPVPVYAQGGAASASLGGRIVDDTGLVLPGVTVTVINESTNQSRTIVTDASGLYRVYGLTPSTYTLTAELEGFASIKLTGLILNVGAVVEREVKMQLADVAETVTVTGEAPLVESARTDMSTVVTRDEIEALPTNSRNRHERPDDAPTWGCRRRARLPPRRVSTRRSSARDASSARLSPARSPTSSSSGAIRSATSWRSRMSWSS